MSLSAALVLLIFLITLVILLIRLFGPLRATSTLLGGGNLSVKDSPEWKTLSETREEIEKDPLLDDQSRTSLINSWRTLADQSKRILESEDSQAGPGLLMRFLSNTKVLVPLLMLASLAFLWGLEDFQFRSAQWKGWQQTQNLSGPTVDQAVTRAEGHPGDGSSLESRVASLQARLLASPDDVEGWVLLARTQAAISQYGPASESLRKALALVPDHPTLLADLADMLAMANNRSLVGEPEKLIARALESDPNHEKALALAASALEQAGDNEGAKPYWERFYAVQQARLAASAANSTPQVPAENAATAVPGWARVGVSISRDIVETASKQAVLFVFAKEQPEAGMPLAAKRVPLSMIKPGVNTLSLADSDWIRGKPESDSVYVQARLAMSGSVAVSDTDRVSEWVQVRLNGEQAQVALELQ